MKKLYIIASMVLGSSIIGFGQSIISGLTDIADAAALVAITTDVIDNTLMTGEKLKILNDELERTQKLLNDPSFMTYTSTYGRNKTLRQVRMHARQVQIYSTTLKNMIMLLTRLSTQITATKAEDAENSIAKALAQIKSAASGTSYLGFSAGGGVDANTVAKLQEQMTADRKNSFQGNVLEFVLELDAFNQGVDRLHYDILGTQAILFRSYGAGVLMNGTSMNLYSYKRAYDQEQLQHIQRAVEANEGQRRATNTSIRQMNAEFVRVAKQSEEYQKKLSNLK